MAGLFNRNKKKQKTEVEKAKVKLKPINYSNMVILAWAKAIEGDVELQKWLRENDYEELVHSVYAIRLKEDSREWLMENGYAHLMAMINACEGNPNAQNWLLGHQFHNLYHVARAVDHEHIRTK